jgi:hypothetical protein
MIGVGTDRQLFGSGRSFSFTARGRGSRLLDGSTVGLVPTTLELGLATSSDTPLSSTARLVAIGTGKLDECLAH